MKVSAGTWCGNINSILHREAACNFWLICLNWQLYAFFGCALYYINISWSSFFSTWESENKHLKPVGTSVGYRLLTILTSLISCSFAPFCQGLKVHNLCYFQSCAPKKRRFKVDMASEVSAILCLIFPKLQKTLAFTHDITWQSSRILLSLEHIDVMCHLKVRRSCNKINFNYYLQYISVSYLMLFACNHLKLLALMYYDGPGGRCNYSSKGSSPGSQHTRGGRRPVGWADEDMRRRPGIESHDFYFHRRCCGLWKCGRGGVLHSECSIYHVYNLAFLHICRDDRDSHALEHILGFKADTTAPLPWVQIRPYQFLVEANGEVHMSGFPVHGRKSYFQ